MVNGMAPIAAEAAALLPAWPGGDGSQGLAQRQAADIVVEAGAVEGAFRIAAASWPGGETHAPDALTAANGLAGLLVDGVLARDPALLALHAGGARLAAGVVLWLGGSGAGKSTLALRLAAAGARLWADDRVLLTLAPPAVVAIGLAAKVRLPFAAGAEDPALAALVARHAALTTPDTAYLDLPPARQARFGERARLAGLVLLDRRPDTPADAPVAVTDDLSPGAMAAALLPQATAPGRPPAELVAALAGLAAAVPRLGLAYRDGAAAAAELIARFGAPAS